jgi:uncharacterized protein YkwD
MQTTKQNVLKILSLAILGFFLGAGGVLLKDYYFGKSNLLNSKISNPNLNLNWFSATPSPKLEQSKPVSPAPRRFNRLKIQRKPLFSTPGIMPSPTPDNEQWGVAKQVSEHTWTIKVKPDEQMTTPQELFEALNNYRKTKGVNPLTWNEKLAAYAQLRADYFASISKIDEHAGFKEYLKNDDNFVKLGFGSLGENSSWGYRLTGVHLIEWVYAADSAHDNNQLDSEWTHVGIGINGTGTDLIFAGNAF